MSRSRYEIRRARSDRNSAILSAARPTDSGRTYLLGYLLASIPTVEMERALASLRDQDPQWGYIYPEADR